MHDCNFRPSHGPAWENPTGYRHGEKNGMRPREVVKSSSLDIFKTQMDTALKNLLE